MNSTFKTVSLLAIVLAIGIFTRSYQYSQRFYYSHDGDLVSWIVKDIVTNKHPRLVGQLTSISGVFIGSFFYYSVAPFYLLTNLDPIGSVFFSIITGTIALLSVFLVFRRLHGSVAAVVASLIYASSFLISFVEREVVPTATVHLWTVWFYFGLNRLFQNQKSSLLIFAILYPLTWHTNLALILTAPLTMVGLAIKRSLFKFKHFILPALIFFLLSLPFILFETRHQFSQTRALFSSSLPTGSSEASFSAKLDRTLTLAYKNANRIFWENPSTIPSGALPLFLITVLIFLHFRGATAKYFLPLTLAWITIFLIFFTFNSINLSEYYINGINILWLSIASLLLAYLINLHPVSKLVAIFMLTLIVVNNLNRFLTADVNRSGYIQKKALVSYIKRDAQRYNYPCVAISYMTEPGYDMGYRYFFYLADLHVNHPDSGSPVYTIVFPHTRAGRLDYTFGALGLVLPDYRRYSPEQVKQSCSGENSNLTDPLFGFTQ